MPSFVFACVHVYNNNILPRMLIWMCGDNYKISFLSAALSTFLNDCSAQYVMTCMVIHNSLIICMERMNMDDIMPIPL